MRDQWMAEATVWSGQTWGVYRFNIWADSASPPEMVRDLAERHALEHFGLVRGARVERTEKDADGSLAGE